MHWDGNISAAIRVSEQGHVSIWVLPFSHMIIQTQDAPRKRIDSKYFVIQLKEVKCTHMILVLAVIKIHPINS